MTRQKAVEIPSRSDGPSKPDAARAWRPPHL